jgi:FkbM family methyltransferase
MSLLRWRDTVVRLDSGALPPDHAVSLRFKAPVRADVLVRGATSDTYTLQEIMIRQVYAGLKNTIPHCETVIDLGANIGLASLYMAALYPQCRILAVEPHSQNVEILKRNLHVLTSTSQAAILQAAVWSRAAILEFQPFADPGAYDSVTVHEAAAPTDKSDATYRSPEANRVAGMPMSSIINRSGFGQVDILKVDIEGAEVELFSGDLSWLERVRSIAIEFHGDARRVSDFDARVRDFGFEIVDENHHTVLALKPSAQGRQSCPAATSPSLAQADHKS